MFVIDTKREIVGLDWRPKHFGRRRHGRERIKWRVWADSFENYYKGPDKYNRIEGGAKEVKPGVFECKDEHGPFADLGYFHGLKKVKIMKINTEEFRTKVVLDPKTVAPAKGGKVIAKLKEREVPWVWSKKPAKKKPKWVPIIVGLGIAGGYLLYETYK